MLMMCMVGILAAIHLKPVQQPSTKIERALSFSDKTQLTTSACSR
jgi:hypothetical protein